MRLTILFLLSAVLVPAATVNITLTFSDSYIPAIKAYILATHPDADTDSNGVLTNAETLAWIESESQRNWTRIAKSATEWAETNATDILPLAHRDALTTKTTAETTLEAEREKAKP